MAQNPWQTDPTDLAKCLATLDRRREHLLSRSTDGRGGPTQQYDQAEAHALELAGATLLRCYLEVVTGIRSVELVREMRKTEPSALICSRADRYLSIVEG